MEKLARGVGIGIVVLEAATFVFGIVFLAKVMPIMGALGAVNALLGIALTKVATMAGIVNIVIGIALILIGLVLKRILGVFSTLFMAQKLESEPAAKGKTKTKIGR